MRKILNVARREYVETIKTKIFLFSLLMTPAIMGLALYFSGRTARGLTAPQPPRNIAVTDLSSELTEEIKTSFDSYNKSHQQRQLLLQGLETDKGAAELAVARHKDRLRRGELDVYVVMDADVVAGRGKMHLYTRGMKAAHLDVLPTIENLLNHAVVSRRCKLRDLPPAMLAELRRRVPVEQVDVSSQDERVRKKSDRVATIVLPFAFMFLMFVGIFGMGQHMISSVIEEKNSRVVEMLLSALSPFELLAGKILGLAGIGLTVMTLWGVGAYAAARWRGLTIDFPIEILPYFVIYYVLGFLFFSSILAGVGSVCNTIKEAQSLMMPVSLVCVLPMLAVTQLLQNPTGTMARVFSFLPPLAPMVMILRLAARADMSPLEVMGSIVVLAASVPAVIWAAARVFRTGILMYGKRPRLREVLRWVRQA